MRRYGESQLFDHNLNVNNFVIVISVKRITDAEYFYNHELNLTYLLITDPSGTIDVYIPKPTTEKINLIDLNRLQHFIIEKHSNIVTNLQHINLHLVTMDSNAVTIYYSHQLRLCELIPSVDLETSAITDSF